MHEGASEIVSWVISALFLLLLLVVFAGLIVRIVRNRFAPVKTVHAKVIKKYRQEFSSKYAGTGKRYRYVVTFLADGKKLSFYVSEFSFGGYKLNETGTLKYKGSRLLDFH